MTLTPVDRTKACAELTALEKTTLKPEQGGAFLGRRSETMGPDAALEGLGRAGPDCWTSHPNPTWSRVFLCASLKPRCLSKRRCLSSEALLVLLFAQYRYRSGPPQVEMPQDTSSATAAAYDDAFMKSLLREPDTEVMVRRAEEAGLIVQVQASDGGAFYQIIDPETHEVLLTSSVSID